MRGWWVVCLWPSPWVSQAAAFSWKTNQAGRSEVPQPELATNSGPLAVLLVLLSVQGAGLGAVWVVFVFQRGEHGHCKAPCGPGSGTGTLSLPPSPIGQRTAPIHAVVSGPVTQHKSLGASLRTTHCTPEAASGEIGRRLRTAMRACLGTRQRQLCSVRRPRRASLGGFSSSCQAQEDCNLPIKWPKPTNDVWGTKRQLTCPGSAHSCTIHFL